MRPTPEMAAAAQKVGAGAQSRSLAMAAMSALAGVVLVAVVMMSHSSGTMVGTETTPVELQMAMLRQAVTEKLSQEKKCGASCVAKKAMVAQQMKELRDQIQHDYHSMVTFGDKAGYVPPPRSIKAQVMDGSLLGGGSSGPAPPPAFKPVVGKASAFGEDKEKKLLASEVSLALCPCALGATTGTDTGVGGTRSRTRAPLRAPRSCRLCSLLTRWRASS